MKIGQLAKATGTQVETIRFYEREGLLSEGARTEANYRLYADAHVDRLAFIRHCRLLGASLDEIRALLSFRDKPQKSQHVSELLTVFIERAAGHMRELERLQADLKKLRVKSTKSDASAARGS